MEALLAAVRNCRACDAHLPLGPRPVLRAAETSRILIVGQAPGVRVHTTGIPWDDPSGERLRAWMGVGKEIFYDESRIAIIPMGYCYPGEATAVTCRRAVNARSCGSTQLLAKLPQIELTLLIGQHAQRHFLGSRRKSSLAETTKAWREYCSAIHSVAPPVAAQYAMVATQFRV